MEENREKVKCRDGVEVCSIEKKRMTRGRKRMREETEGKRKTERCNCK